MWVETKGQEKYQRKNKRDVVFVVSSYVWTCEREKVTEKIPCIFFRCKSANFFGSCESIYLLYDKLKYDVIQ